MHKVGLAEINFWVEEIMSNENQRARDKEGGHSQVRSGAYGRNKVDKFPKLSLGRRSSENIFAEV